MNPHDIRVGDDLPSLAIDRISRTTLALFAGASGDHQPTHIDIDAAKAKGRADVIAHGMLMMAFMSRVLLAWAPQDAIKHFKARFVAMTPVNAEPTCTARVVEIKDGLAMVDLTITLADGMTTVRGEAAIDLGRMPTAYAHRLAS